MSKSKNNPPVRQPQQLRRVLPQQQLIERREEYQGLIPPPVILQQFEELQAGTASRIIQWAEDEQRHRQSMEREAQEANIAAQQKQLQIADNQSRAVFRSDITGQVLGFCVCMACVAGAVALALNGHTAAAVALAAIPTAAVIQAFRSGVFANRRPSAPPPKR